MNPIGLHIFLEMMRQQVKKSVQVCQTVFRREIELSTAFIDHTLLEHPMLAECNECTSSYEPHPIKSLFLIKPWCVIQCKGFFNTITFPGKLISEKLINFWLIGNTITWANKLFQVTTYKSSKLAKYRGITHL